MDTYRFAKGGSFSLARLELCRARHLYRWQITKSLREMCGYLFGMTTIYRVNYIPANREPKSIDEAPVSLRKWPPPVLAFQNPRPSLAETQLSGDFSRMNCNGQQVRAANAAAVVSTLLTLLFVFAEAAVPAQAQTPTVLHHLHADDRRLRSPRQHRARPRRQYVRGWRRPAEATAPARSTRYLRLERKACFSASRSNGPYCGGAGLTLGSDGNFYGACEAGNPATGLGSIFRLTPAGVFTDLHDFTGANGDSLPVYPPIQASDGNFYGVTGNEVQVCGNIYQLTPAGVYTNLHTFSGSDCHSSNLVQASDGNLYGTLANCPVVQGAGCVYKISTAGVFKEIHDFAFTTGQVPCTGLIQGKDGKLYGATQPGSGEWLRKYLQDDHGRSRD